MIIEIGGGDKPLYHPNIDIRFIDGVDIVAYATNLPIRDNSIEYIYTSHMIEHLGFREHKNFLMECYRVLKNHGKIEILCPDFKAAVKIYLREGFSWRVLKMLFGTQEHRDDFHKSGLDEDTLINLLREVGFKNIVRGELRDFKKAELLRYGEVLEPELHLIGEKDED